MALALARMARWRCLAADRASMRAWRSTYWAVTSSPLVVTAPTLPNPRTWLRTASKLEAGTRKVTEPDGAPPMSEDCVAETNPPLELARVVRPSIVRSKPPFLTPSWTLPVLTTRGVWPACGTA